MYNLKLTSNTFAMSSPCHHAISSILDNPSSPILNTPLCLQLSISTVQFCESSG